MTLEKMLAQVDIMTPMELLIHWRFDPVGHPFVTGIVGTRVGERLFKWRTEHPDEWEELSKLVGWDR